MAKRSDVDGICWEAFEAGLIDENDVEIDEVVTLATLVEVGDRTPAEAEVEAHASLADESEFAELYAAGFWDLGSE